MKTRTPKVIRRACGQWNCKLEKTFLSSLRSQSIEQYLYRMIPSSRNELSCSIIAPSPSKHPNEPSIPFTRNDAAAIVKFKKRINHPQNILISARNSGEFGLSSSDAFGVEQKEFKCPIPRKRPQSNWKKKTFPRWNQDPENYRQRWIGGERGL